MSEERKGFRRDSGSPVRAKGCFHLALAFLIVLACGAILFPMKRSQVLAAPATGGDPTQSFVVTVLGAMERQTLEFINRDRATQDYWPETRGRAFSLLWDDRLAAVARAHSEDMIRNGYFSHMSSDGAPLSQRISSAGIEWTYIGENIAACQTISQAESAFMDEPKFQRNHRWNILNPEYTRAGVGIAKGPDGMLYITEDFAQTR
jgi:uncharacterized protein YkwD